MSVWKDNKKDGFCKQKVTTDKIGKPEEIMKSLHFHIDWIRAIKKRDPPDNRGVNVEQLLLKIQEGMLLTDEGWEWHYNGE